MPQVTQVRKKGQFTIPFKVRDEVGIDENDALTIIPLGTAGFIAVNTKLSVPDLLQKAAAKAKKRGVSLEEMLEELDEIRHQS